MLIIFNVCITSLLNRRIYYKRNSIDEVRYGVPSILNCMRILFTAHSSFLVPPAGWVS